MNHKISVIIPMYNAQEYIEKCIFSILNQTYKNIEILVIDDGSKDRSKEIVERLALDDERIVYLYQKNAGACSALNHGISLATGDYITFTDNDDYVEAKTYEIVVNHLNEIEYDLIIFGFSYDFVDEKYSIISHMENMSANNREGVKKIIPCIFENNLFHTFWNKMYKTSVIKNNNIWFDERYNSMGDYAFNCKLFAKLNSLDVIDFVGYHYLKRNRDSLVASYIPHIDECLEERRKVTIDLADEYNLFDNERFRKYYIKQYYLESEDFLINLYKSKCPFERIEKIGLINNYILDEASISNFKQLKPETIYAKIFKKVVLSKSARKIDFVYNNLTKFKNLLFPIYRRFREKQYKKTLN